MPIFVAALYKKMGYRVLLTPSSGDKDIDVLAMNGDGGYAIQVKHSKKNVGVEGVYEAYTGSSYYAQNLSWNFRSVLLTNSTTFTPQTQGVADSVGVMLINRKVLLDMLASNKITYEDVATCEFHRLHRI